MSTFEHHDFIVRNNATWEAAFQFGDPDDAPDTLIATATMNVYTAAAAAAAADPDNIDLALAADKAYEQAIAAEVSSWSFTNKTFRLDVKASKDDVAALLSLTSANGRIVVDDAVRRILHFNVSSDDIIANLPVGRYIYDLIMLDDSAVPIRTTLMAGSISVVQGVTGS